MSARPHGQVFVDGVLYGTKSIKFDAARENASASASITFTRPDVPITPTSHVVVKMGYLISLGFSGETVLDSSRVESIRVTMQAEGDSLNIAVQDRLGSMHRMSPEVRLVREQPNINPYEWRPKGERSVHKLLDHVYKDRLGYADVLTNLPRAGVARFTVGKRQNFHKATDVALQLWKPRYIEDVANNRLYVINTLSRDLPGRSHSITGRDIEVRTIEWKHRDIVNQAELRWRDEGNDGPLPEDVLNDPDVPPGTGTTGPGSEGGGDTNTPPGSEIPGDRPRRRRRRRHTTRMRGVYRYPGGSQADQPEPVGTLPERVAAYSGYTSVWDEVTRAKIPNGGGYTETRKRFLEFHENRADPAEVTRSVEIGGETKLWNAVNVGAGITFPGELVSWVRTEERFMPGTNYKLGIGHITVTDSRIVEPFTGIALMRTTQVEVVEIDYAQYTTDEQDEWTKTGSRSAVAGLVLMPDGVPVSTANRNGVIDRTSNSDQWLDWRLTKSRIEQISPIGADQVLITITEWDINGGLEVSEARESIGKARVFTKNGDDYQKDVVWDQDSIDQHGPREPVIIDAGPIGNGGDTPTPTDGGPLTGDDGDEQGTPSAGSAGGPSNAGEVEARRRWDEERAMSGTVEARDAITCPRLLFRLHRGAKIIVTRRLGADPQPYLVEGLSMEITGNDTETPKASTQVEALRI